MKRKVSKKEMELYIEPAEKIYNSMSVVEFDLLIQAAKNRADKFNKGTVAKDTLRSIVVPED